MAGNRARGTFLVASVVAGCLASACALVTGLSEYDVTEDGDASSSSSSSSTSSSASSSSGSSGASSGSSSGEIDAGDTRDAYVSPPIVDASSPTGWSAKRKLTLSVTDKNINDSAFTVLVVLDASRINYGITGPGGRDLRFVDPNAGNQLLPYEIESWSPTGKSRVWVKVPITNTPIKQVDLWMFYGNSQATDGQDATHTWDSYLGVWHLVDAHDSTGKHTSANGAAGLQGASLGALENGTATSFNTNQVIDTGVSENFPQWTLEASFITANGSQANVGARAFISRDTYQVQWDCTTSVFCRTANIGTNFPKYASFGNPPLNTWHTVVATYNGSNLVTYLDGNQENNVNATGSLPNSQTHIWIGRSLTQNGGSFVGGLDEVRISNTVRSANYVTLDYRSRTDNAIVWGAEQANPAGTLTP